MLQDISAKRFASIRRLDCVGSPKVDPTLKLSNYEAMSQRLHFYRTNVETSTSCFGDISCFFANVFYMPLQNFTDYCFRRTFGIPEDPKVLKIQKHSALPPQR